jgi:hypothetical protein
MPLIHSSDPDFRIFHIGFDVLVDIQLEAERAGLATRWSSVDDLRGQVNDSSCLLQALMREERHGAVRSYRCLLLFQVPAEGRPGGITTIDLTPERYGSLERVDGDPGARKALVRIFSLALGGISSVSKNLPLRITR